ncbi:MAG: hypothetical protein CMI29_04710 [Opitutae bacterium]|nr:hypothetical protein [Opitutae bacterium]
MKKPFHAMLERKVGTSAVSHPWLNAFLKSEGFTKMEVRAIMIKYFHPTINRYKLKSWPDE